MNHKIGKLLKRYATATKSDERAVKRAWRSATRLEKTKWRVVMKQAVGERR
jgi:hypothetical protein